jgi:putative sterol carrier protein
MPAFARAVDRAWHAYLPQLEVVRMIARVTAPPPPIADATLGAQLNYLDSLWNAVAQPMEAAAADRKARLGR